MAGEARLVRIGGASGFWGDSSVGAPQLVASGQVDYLVFDYLAELTMSILAGARLKKPELGYATDFVSVAMKSVLRDVVAHGIRVVSNAGGVNPQGCADALAALAAEQGVALKIAVVLGDDVMPLLPALREQAPPVAELQSGAPLPPKVLTANAYLGALPIRAALDAGAQVVITGRCVDSAVTLGVLLHEFGWAADDYDRLAAGSLGRPSAGMRLPGHRRPAHRLGQRARLAEHRLPHRRMPRRRQLRRHQARRQRRQGHAGRAGRADALRDRRPGSLSAARRGVRLHAGDDAPGGRTPRGSARRQWRAPTDSYKVCATYVDGFKTSAQLTIVGFDAVAKARRTGEAILAPHRPAAGAGQLRALHREPCRSAGRRVVLWPACAGAAHARGDPAPHRDAPAQGGAGAVRARSGAGRHLVGAGHHGRGRRSRLGLAFDPAIRLSAAQAARRAGRATGEERLAVAQPAGQPAASSPAALPAARQQPADAAAAEGETLEVPLIRLAWARSGDKGDTSNIGVIARRPEWLALLRAELTEERVASYLAHLVHGRVTRYELPGVNAFNFVCEQALDGGGMASMRNDALGKGMAQILLSLPLRVPAALLLTSD